MHEPGDGFTVRQFFAGALGLLSGFRSAKVSAFTSDTVRLEIRGATIEISCGPGHFDLPREAIIAWVSKAAHTVAHYYGTFPVPLMRVRVNPSEREGGPFGGTTWGTDPPFTRISVGRDATSQHLEDDWLMTHELVHTAFPDVADEHHWIEEGIATYVEPIARAQVGDLTPEKVWGDMVRGMPKGEPQAFDKGLDHTHTWGRTYWGGALFCLLADVRVRRASNNRKCLQDALRGIRDAGGTIDKHWPVTRAFETGDNASQTQVLANLYSEMKDRPVYVNLDTLWKELGVSSHNNIVSFDDGAPLAEIRRAITLGKSS